MEKQILEIFDYFGFSPRAHQVETVKKIVETFYNKNKKFVCLSAPTGSGKSLIAMVVSELIGRKENDDKCISEILIHTKTLQNQYESSFDKKLLNIKGAASYTCPMLKSNADDCMIKIHSDKGVPPKCEKCDYRNSRKRLNKEQHIVTNYSFHLTSSLNTKFINRRLINIFDESHLINDLYCSHVSINLDVKLLRSVYKILTELGMTDGANKVSRLITEIMPTLNDHNYKDVIFTISNVLSDIVDNLKKTVMDHLTNQNYDMYKKVNKTCSRISNINFKLTDFLDRNFECVKEISNGESIKIQPIFIGPAFKKNIQNSTFTVFMSATINADFLSTVLEIPLKDIEFIEVPSTFPKENKRVVFINHTSYNFKSMSDEKVLRDMENIILDIINSDDHIKQKGIILTPSFKINDRLAETLNDVLTKKNKIKVFSQQEGEQLNDVLQNFMVYDKPSVLLSPSIWEGISLDGKISEYQIMVKAPYGYLGDKRVKYIFDNHKNIYNIQTLFKVIQGLGRSSRSKDEKSITYCLDTNLHNIFMSPINIWKKEFQYDVL